MAFLFNNLLHDLNAKIKDGKLIVDSSSEEESIYPIRQVGPNAFIVNYNGKPVRAYVAADEKKVYVFVDGRNFTFKKCDEDQADYEVSSPDHKSLSIKAPMPGTIIKILASKGDILNEGDPVIIVEAMKMETTLYSAISGIIKELNVKTGEQVDADKSLALIEKVD